MPFIGHFLWKTFNFDLFYGKRMKNSQQIGRKSTYFSKKCIISLISVNNSMLIVSKSAFSHPKTYNKHVIWYFDSHMRSKDSIEKIRLFPLWPLQVASRASSQTFEMQNWKQTEVLPLMPKVVSNQWLPVDKKTGSLIWGKTSVLSLILPFLLNMV